MKGERKHNDDKNLAILVRWNNDKRYRNSQLALGWTEDYCCKVDYFTAVDITHNAPPFRRLLIGSTLTMKCSDPNPQLGPMRNRKDNHETTNLLMKLREEQDRTSTYIPISQRTREKNTLDPEVHSSWSWSPSWWQDTQCQDTRWECHQWHAHQWRDLTSGSSDSLL